MTPRWNVQVLDDRGIPVPSCAVYQSWCYFGLTDDQSEEKRTDSQGKVSFLPRSINVSEIRYTASHAASLLNVHASFEPSAHINVFKEGFKPSWVYFEDNKLRLGDSGAEGGVTNNVINIVVHLRPYD